MLPRLRIKAGDLDEKAALEIEGQRLRTAKDAAQAEADALVIQRCLALPDAKEAAEQAQVLTQRAKEADEAVLPYWDNVRSHWQSLAAAYQQKAQGGDYKKTRSITLPPPADADRRRAEFASAMMRRKSKGSRTGSSTLSMTRRRAWTRRLRCIARKTLPRR